jgi:membrane protein
MRSWLPARQRDVHTVMPAIAAAARGYGAHGLPQHAAAISFRVLFSFVPLIGLTISLLHLVLPADVAERLADWLIGELVGAPELEESVDRVVVGGTVIASLAGLVALAGLAWSASGLIAAVRLAFQSIWLSAHRRPYIRGKVVDIALVFGAGIVAIVGFALGIVAEAVAQLGGNLGNSLGLTSPGDWLGEVVGIVTSLLLTLLCFTALYVVVPPERPRWRAVWPGALAGAIGFELATVVYGWYLTQFSDLALVYGSLGALFGFLLVVYWGVVAMLLGAEIIAAKGPDEPAAGQPRAATDV